VAVAFEAAEPFGFLGLGSPTGEAGAMVPSMTRNAAQVVAAALELPESDRLQVALALVTSVNRTAAPLSKDDEQAIALELAEAEAEVERGEFQELGELLKELRTEHG
jgi:hypothetical protein